MSPRAVDSGISDTGSWYSGGSYIYFTYGDMDLYTACKFDMSSLPAGAVITAASLEFHNLYKNINSVDLEIFGESDINPVAFYSGNLLPARKLTTNTIHWDAESNETGDVAGIINEIYALPNWDTTKTFVLITKRISSPTTNWWGGTGYVRARSHSTYFASQRPELHITYTENQAELAVVPASLGPSCYVGYDATSETVTITNIGTNSFDGTISADQPWISFSGWDVTASNPLVAGASKMVTVSYATSALSSGTYLAHISVTGNAINSPLDIPVTLTVQGLPFSASCGEIPLYAENLVTPAIMVQLDTSGSMSTSMPVLADGTNPVTPAIPSIVQEIVDRPGWASSQNMAFAISGTGSRKAWSYDGLSNAAPKLYVKYTFSGTTYEKEYAVSASTDDVQDESGSLNTNQTYLDLGQSDPVGLRFSGVDIPPGSSIVDAKITFVINSGTTTTTNLVINGINLDDAPPFTSVAQLTTDLTTASVSWSVQSWGNTQSRIAIAENVLAEVFEDRSISWGFATWAGGSCSSSDSDNDPTFYTNYRIGVHDHDSNHQTQLQDKVNDGSPSGCTPMTPTLKAGLAYFQGSRNDSYYVEPYASLSCQPRILVIVTDGIGNTATTLANVGTSTQALINEGVTVVAVGFGIPPSDAGQIYSIANLSQAAGKTSEDDYLYPLHDEDANGNGIPFIAQSREDFINAMTSIVTNVKAQVFQGSNPAPTTSADDGEILLTATFDASNWSGDVMATKFDPITGLLETTTVWAAESQMPSVINAYIYDTTSASVIPYTDSSLANDNWLCKPLGDIINSTPKIVGAPPYFYNFDGYRVFKYDTDVRARDTLAYVGSNDGALHALNLDDGVERWRYYPESVRDELDQALTVPNKDMCAPSYCHSFLVDGSPEAADIYNGTDWKTIVMTGLGRGGEAFFTLDVTYGNNMGAATTNNSSLLWEFDEIDAPELGLATSHPTITRTGGAVWGAFFGSGDGINVVVQANKKAYLFGVNAWNMGYIWKDSAVADTFKIKLSDTIDNTPNSPLCINLVDDDFQIDHIYIGDLYGDMFRVNHVGNGEQPAVATFFDSVNTDHSTPITGKAGFGYGGDDDKDNFLDAWIYFGTGQYKEQIDKTTSDQQYFFGLKDLEASSSYIMTDLVPLTTDLITASALDSDGNVVAGTENIYRTINGTNSLNGSWVLSLYDPSTASERSLNQPLVVGGVVFFTTFIPDSDVCEGNGDAYLFALDMETGLPAEGIFDINKDGLYDDNDKVVQDGAGTTYTFGGFHVGKGVPTDPVIHKDILFIGTVSGSDGIPKTFKINLDKLRSRIKSWQQKFN